MERRRRAPGVLAAALALIAVAVAPGTPARAGAAEETSFSRVSQDTPSSRVSQDTSSRVSQDTTRIAEAATTPTEAAIALSREQFADASARWAVVVRDDDYADALAGSTVAATAGPLLFTDSTVLSPGTRHELERVLPEGRTVYVMGGSSAVRDSVVAALATRWHVERVSGPDRVQTALTAARLVDTRDRGGELPRRVVAASGYRWPDAVTAGAGAIHVGAALLLVNPAADAHEASNSDVLAYVRAAAPERLWVMGGPVAVPESHAAALVQAAPGAVAARLAGRERAGTAARAAQAFFPEPAGWTIVRGYPGPDEDDASTRAWGYALAASGRAAALRRPPLLVHGRAVPGTWDGVTLATAEALDRRCEPAADVVGSVAVVSDAALREIHRLRCSGLPAVDVRVHVDGLQVPWAVADIGEGRLLVTERDRGQVRLVENGTLTAKPVWTVPDLYREGEAGLMGIAAPTFHRDSQFFVCVTQNTASGPRIRVLRLVMATPEEALPLGTVVDVGRAAAHHDGCQLAATRDGHLLVTSGDAGRPQDADDPTRPNGKVHRVRLEDGAPVPGNVHGSIWTIGHRNPQGLDQHPVTPVVLAVEHGPTHNDEVNVLRDGRDYGWPQAMGPDNDPDTIDPIWASGSSTIAASGGAVAQDPSWQRLRGALLVAALSGSALYALPLTPDGARAAGPLVTLVGREHGRLRGVARASGGGAWVTTSNCASGCTTDVILHVAAR